MTDYVLSVWTAGDEPADGGAPIRLSRVGDAGPVAEHPAGFDTSAFRHGGVPVDPEASLSPAGLMDEAGKASVGDQLWQRLTPGAVGAALRPLLGTARIYLDLRSDGLLHYPWELLRCANHYVFMAPNSRWVLGRPDPPEPGFAGAPPASAHPLRVLLVIGNHPDDKNIQAAEELMAIEREAHLRNAEVLLTTLHHPKATLIEATLKDFRPHVFHFIGHGGGNRDDPPEIYVHAAATGISDPWSADRIRAVFAQAPPRLVLLNACQTGHAPTAAGSLMQAFLDAGCLAVVAMMGDIQGAASAAFSERFYQEIFSGATVDVAAARARMAVFALAGTAADMLQVRSHWALPRVGVRGDVGAAVTMPHAGRPAAVRWLVPDFVARWTERWLAWTAMDGSLQGENGTEARLAVVYGSKEAGKQELLNALAEAHARAGTTVVYAALAGGSTGGWRDLLDRIATAAAAAGLDATDLQTTAKSPGSSATVIARFRADLERLRQSPEDTGPVLVVLDGLSDWTTDEVEQTVLPELCCPLVRAPAGSRLHMIISLTGLPPGQIWGARPARWAPVEVGAFQSAEWERAVRHFRDYWYPRIPPVRQEMLDSVAAAVAGVPYAYSLHYLRSVAKS